MAVDPGGIGREQDRVLPRHFCRTKPLHAGKSKGQHRPPTAQRRAGIGDRIQQIAQPKPLKTDIRCRHQIAAGIGQSAIKIKNDAFHRCFVTWCKVM